MKVVILDDSVMVRTRLKDLLADLPDVEVVGEAGDGCTAVSLIQSVNPDVVILDLKMPRGSGFDVLRRIKRDGGRPAVIVLTNYGSLTPYRTACAEAGVDCFLNKTTEIFKVADVLEALK